MVLVGCDIGTAVNITVAPPLRFPSAAYIVSALVGTLHDLASHMHPVLRQVTLDAESTTRRYERAARTGSLRPGPDTAKESAHYGGVLVVEATGLVDEVQYTGDTLQSPVRA